MRHTHCILPSIGLSHLLSACSTLEAAPSKKRWQKVRNATRLPTGTVYAARIGRDDWLAESCVDEIGDTAYGPTIRIVARILVGCLQAELREVGRIG